MPDEGFVLLCLLAAIGKIAITGRMVSVRGLPSNSLSRAAWGGGQKCLFLIFTLSAFPTYRQQRWCSDNDYKFGNSSSMSKYRL